MQRPVDFVTALTTEIPADFVTALTAEQGCDVCHELHAAVYELRCTTCEAAICPDCARLQPNASWSCSVCYERNPVRVFPAREPVHLASAERAMVMRSEVGRAMSLARSMSAWMTWMMVRSHRLGLAWERVQRSLSPALRELSAASARAARRSLSATRRATRRSVAVARVAGSRARTELAVRTAQARVRGAHALSLANVRARSMLASGRVHGGAQLALRRDQAQQLTQRAHRISMALANDTRAFARRARVHSGRVLVRTRDGALHGWITLRNWPLRQHASAFAFAALMVYAVARADHRD